MPHFVFLGHDGPHGATRRNQSREAHVEFIRALDRAGRIVLAGPIRNDAGDASIGAVIVFEDADLASARRTMAADPYAQAGVYATASVAPFRCAFPERS